jgi:hypothetical protein
MRTSLDRRKQQLANFVTSIHSIMQNQEVQLEPLQSGVIKIESV